MGGKINLYNLGEKGVNVDKSPIHIDDAELRRAQNFQIDTVGSRGGVRRRDGMLPLNGAALAGAGQGIIGLPLPDDRALTRHFYAGVDDFGGALTHFFRHSTNGAAWTFVDAPVVRPLQEAQLTGGLPTIIFDHSERMVVWTVLKNKLYYPGNDYVSGTSLPTLHVFDGAVDAIVTVIPPNPNLTTKSVGILSIVPYDDTRVILTVEDNTAKGRAILIDVTTGQATTIGAQSDVIFCVKPIVFQGKIWYLGHNSAGGGFVPGYWARIADATWTLDTSSITGNANTGYIMGGCVFLGELYCGSNADVGANAVIRKRKNDATWTTQKTNTGATQGNFFGPFIVSADGLTLFVFQDRHTIIGNGTSTAGEQMILSSTDGAAFATDLDVGSTINNSYNFPGHPVLDTNGDIYWVVTSVTSSMSKILKRTVAGVWSVVDTTPLHGPISWLRF